MKIKLKRAADRPMETHSLSSHLVASSSTDNAITSLEFESDIMICLFWDSLLLQRTRTEGIYNCARLDSTQLIEGCVGIMMCIWSVFVCRVSSAKDKKKYLSERLESAK